jgi:hypothetical protein
MIVLVANVISGAMFSESEIETDIYRAVGNIPANQLTTKLISCCERTASDHRSQTVG